MFRNIFLILFVIKMTLLVNSGAQKECFRELELELEIRSVLTTINENLLALKTDLNEQINKGKIEAINKIEKRILNQDESFKVEVAKIKKEILAETENVLLHPQLTGINHEVKVNNDIVTDEGNTSTTLPSDCKAVQERGFHSSGPYQIQPKLAKKPFSVWCDMKTEKGGWTYLLKRFNGLQNFNLNWTDYRRGFGNLSGEHWLGLERMYELTNSKSYKLLIELVDWKSVTAQAFYSNFRIGNDSEDYPVKNLGDYSGNAIDSFIRHLGIKFSTPDRDNDLKTDGVPCAQYLKAGWWFSDCYRSLLTGRYIFNPLPNGDYFYQSAIKWQGFHGFNYSLKEARMMIKPIQ